MLLASLDNDNCIWIVLAALAATPDDASNNNARHANHDDHGTTSSSSSSIDTWCVNIVSVNATGADQFRRAGDRG